MSLIWVLLLDLNLRRFIWNLGLQELWFEGMKLEINEWKISTESQFMYLDAINDQANSLARLSKDLAQDAVMAGVNLTLCGEKSNCKNVLIQVKE